MHMISQCSRVKMIYHNIIRIIFYYLRECRTSTNYHILIRFVFFSKIIFLYFKMCLVCFVIFYLLPHFLAHSSISLLNNISHSSKAYCNLLLMTEWCVKYLI